MVLKELFPKFDKLHKIHGSKKLTSIYGAGQIENPNICLIFMNPTSKNIASQISWKGLKAPWLGTKNVWKLLYNLGLFKNELMLKQILSKSANDWTEKFAENLYKEIEKESIYITNIAKCTQDDARPLSDAIYKEYLPLMLEELNLIKPKVIIALGNQVSSILLSKKISVSNYLNDAYEDLVLPTNTLLKIFPTYYPIGQGTPNMPKAFKRIKNILELLN